MRQRFTLSRFGTDLAFLGVVIMIIGASLNAYYGYHWFESLMYIGIIFIFFPLSIFHFTLTAGIAGPQITSEDFKKIWLWFFQVVFFVSYIFLFFGMNMLFDFIPKFRDEYALFSLGYLEASIPHVISIYLLVLIAGVSLRVAVLQNEKLA